MCIEHFCWCEMLNSFSQCRFLNPMVGRCLSSLHHGCFSTGPKAFLMALAIPLGQSALALAFEKLWGWTESKPKRKYRMKRKCQNVNDT